MGGRLRQQSQNRGRIRMQMTANTGRQTAVKNRPFAGVELVSLQSLQLAHGHLQGHRQYSQMDACLHSGLTQQLPGSRSRTRGRCKAGL